MIDNLKNNKILLLIGIVLLGVGLLKPDLSSLISPQNNTIVDTADQIKKPTDESILEACSGVINALKEGSKSSRAVDGKQLSSLYRDIASLIKLDGEDTIIKSTLEIREANRLSGLLSRINVKGKYPELSTACNNVVMTGLGKDDVVLDETARAKAVDVFMALSWACLEGSK